MSAKAYKVAYPGGRTETLMSFKRSEQKDIEADLDRLHTEGLVTGYVIQDPKTQTEKRKDL